MSQSAGEPFTLHDPLEWMRDLIRDSWRAPRVQKPQIDLRSGAGDVRVENGDFVLLYFGDGPNPENIGTRHRHEQPVISIDIRTYHRADALKIRDEVKRILDFAAVKPDPYGEWDELLLTGEHYPADYGGASPMTQIVLDIEVHRYLRPRPLPRLLGGLNK